MKELSPPTFICAILIGAAVLLFGAVLTPHDRYYRWQELQTKFSRRGDWIYERLHFDPTPIDVVIVGTSRIAGDISGPGLERSYCEATGRRLRVANIAYPGIGRNIQYAFAKEAIAAKKPKLVLIELDEYEARGEHESFIVVADAVDVIAAPIVINRSYISDFGRLAGRQLSLFFKTIAGTPNVRRAFDPDAYDGPNQDQTRYLRMLDGSVRSRFVRATPQELERSLRAHRRDKRTAEASKPLERVAYAAARHYLRRIERLAQEAGGDTQYVFIPAYREPSMPESVRRRLDIDGPVIDLGGPIAHASEYWRDATHLNAWGAIMESRRLGRELARTRPLLGAAGCDPAAIKSAPP